MSFLDELVNCSSVAIQTCVGEKYFATANDRADELRSDRQTAGRTVPQSTVSHCASPVEKRPATARHWTVYRLVLGKP